MLRTGLAKAARGAAAFRPTANGTTVRFMSAKDIKFGVDGRTAMLKGVDTLADAVQVSFCGVVFEPSEWNFGTEFYREIPFPRTYITRNLESFSFVSCFEGPRFRSDHDSRRNLLDSLLHVAP